MADPTIFFQTMAAIPEGRFTSYGAIAALCGVHVRQVQAWLRKLPKDSGLPWYRIINSQYKITPHPGSERQHQLLAAEGLLANINGKYPVDRFWPDDKY